LFAKPYTPQSRYYLVQEAEQFFAKVLEPHQAEKRTFEEIMRADCPLKFFMEVSYQLAPANQSGTEKIMRTLREEIALQWHRDTGKTVRAFLLSVVCCCCSPLDSSLLFQAAEDGWIEFDRSDAFTVQRTLYNYKMGFRNVEHLYTFVSRLEAGLQAKKVRREFLFLLADLLLPPFCLGL
jgi:hypothetical protein